MKNFCCSASRAVINRWKCELITETAWILTGYLSWTRARTPMKTRLSSGDGRSNKRP